MKEKAPNCFKDKIFHHGQLSKADLTSMTNGLIIIDEIDTGDKEYQVLHNTLHEAGVLDVRHMTDRNNRFIFISATMIAQLYQLYRWGDLHQLYKMTIPSAYIGHADFLEKRIIQEFYRLDCPENAEKWVKEDIIDNYGNDFRVHIVRINTKLTHHVQYACIRNGIAFRNHTSTDRLSPDEIKEFFKEDLTQHIVLGVKGFFRRANLIPNAWKLRIGATHESYTDVINNNVQIQGLTGRMTGYWRDDIESGHKTGPHRTSTQAIEQYEIIYNDPFGVNSYQTDGFKKKNGRVTSRPTMLSPANIPNLIPVALPRITPVDINLYRVYDNETKVIDVCRILGYHYTPTRDNTNGFKETSLNNSARVVSLVEAIVKVPTAYGTYGGGIRTYRTYYPCYVDITNRTTLRFVVIIRPGTDAVKLAECDRTYPRI
jgi:hypothetical protein